MSESTMWHRSRTNAMPMPIGWPVLMLISLMFVSFLPQLCPVVPPRYAQRENSTVPADETDDVKHEAGYAVDERRADPGQPWRVRALRSAAVARLRAIPRLSLHGAVAGHLPVPLLWLPVARLLAVSGLLPVSRLLLAVARRWLLPVSLRRLPRLLAVPRLLPVARLLPVPGLLAVARLLPLARLLAISGLLAITPLAVLWQPLAAVARLIGHNFSPHRCSGNLA
jgi:hypothetical protein